MAAPANCFAEEIVKFRHGSIPGGSLKHSVTGPRCDRVGATLCGRPGFARSRALQGDHTGSPLPASHPNSSHRLKARENTARPVLGEVEGMAPPRPIEASACYGASKQCYPESALFEPCRNSHKILAIRQEWMSLSARIEQNRGEW